MISSPLFLGDRKSLNSVTNQPVFRSKTQSRFRFKMCLGFCGFLECLPAWMGVFLYAAFQKKVYFLPCKKESLVSVMHHTYVVHCLLLLRSTAGSPDRILRVGSARQTKIQKMENVLQPAHFSFLSRVLKKHGGKNNLPVNFFHYFNDKIRNKETFLFMRHQSVIDTAFYLLYVFMLRDAVAF